MEGARIAELERSVQWKAIHPCKGSVKEITGDVQIGVAAFQSYNVGLTTEMYQMTVIKIKV